MNLSQHMIPATIIAAFIALISTVFGTLISGVISLRNTNKKIKIQRQIIDEQKKSANGYPNLPPFNVTECNLPSCSPTAPESYPLSCIKDKMWKDYENIVKDLMIVKNVVDRDVYNSIMHLMFLALLCSKC